MNNMMRLILLEKQNKALKLENRKLNAIVEYIGAMDYPEVFEEVTDHDNTGNGEE